MFPRLFPDVPEDLAALGDEALAELLDSFRSVSRALRAGEIDLTEAFGEGVSQADASAEAMRQWQEAAETVTAVRAEQTRREEELAAFATEAEQLDAQFSDETAAEEADAADVEEAVAAPVEGEETETLTDESEESEEPEPAGEPEASAEPETVAAGGRVVRFPAVPRRHEARELNGENPVVLVAAAGNSSARVRAGAALTRDEYAQAVVDVARSRGAVKRHREGGEERILVASADFRYPEERTLLAGDPEGNARKIRDAGGYFMGPQAMEALTADGTICAPPTPIYTLPDLETTARPVRDSLATFSADRGGVSVPTVDTIATIMDGDAITVIENGDPADSVTTKSCMAMDCAEWVDTFVGTIAHCRSVGNLNARTWPEGVAKQNSLTMAALARTADGRLLDNIDALSLAIDGSAVYGASSTLLYRLQLSRVGIISRLRLPTNTRFDVLLPFYAAEMFSLDLVNNGEQPGRFDTTQDQVGALLSRFGFNVTWHLDQGIDGGADDEVFASQSDSSPQVDWPGSLVIARLYPAGTFIRLDGGTLELGIVRDSSLNETNDYQLFGELWENVARIGPQAAAHRIAITICPDGTVAPAADSVFTCVST